MPLPHVQRIIDQRDAAFAQLEEVRAQLTEIEAYLVSDKFAAPDNDYVHVRTDILPKVSRVRFATVRL